MVKFGKWEAKFSKNFPQKIASAVSGELNLVGATYEAFAYLGSQTVTGVNHAVLAEQTVLCGKDVKNAVMLIFNEKSDSMDVSLTDIRRIVEAGGELGGPQVAVSLDVPAEAQKALDEALEGWVGTSIKPVAYLGQQVTKGTDFILLAEVTPVVPDATADLAIITVNGLDKRVRFDKLFEDASDAPVALSYWIVKGQKFGAPLGEWP